MKLEVINKVLFLEGIVANLVQQHLELAIVGKAPKSLYAWKCWNHIIPVSFLFIKGWGLLLL
jgi:hypothetical protein